MDLLYLQVVQLLRDTHAGKVTPQAQQVLVECLNKNVCLQYAPERAYSRCCHIASSLLYVLEYDVRCIWRSRLLRALVLAVEEDREGLLDQVADLHAQNLTGSLQVGYPAFAVDVQRPSCGMHAINTSLYQTRS